MYIAMYIVIHTTHNYYYNNPNDRFDCII